MFNFSVKLDHYCSLRFLMLYKNEFSQHEIANLKIDTCDFKKIITMVQSNFIREKHT